MLIGFEPCFGGAQCSAKGRPFPSTLPGVVVGAQFREVVSAGEQLSFIRCIHLLVQKYVVSLAGVHLPEHRPHDDFAPGIGPLPVFACSASGLADHPEWPLPRRCHAAPRGTAVPCFMRPAEMKNSVPCDSANFGAARSSPSSCTQYRQAMSRASPKFS